MELNTYSIMIISHDLELTYEVRDSLLPLETTNVICPNYPSFSKVCNEEICKAENDIVIIASYKARPKCNDVYRLISLLNNGYAFVGLYRFGFFGFRKDLINRIGFFDERFIGGEYEDCDFLRRVIEANLAYYDDESIDFIIKPSTWNNEYTKEFFLKKWEHQGNTIKRLLVEEKYNYQLNYNKTNIVYKDRTFSHSFSPDTEKFCKTIQFL